MDKKDYWETRRDGVPLAGGPKSTFPNAEERKSLRSGGLKIYVEGKLFREGKETVLNHITIIGRLARDPELRRTGSGVAVASFTVGVERDFADSQSGKKEMDWIECVAWRQTGEFVSKYFRKGNMIAVSGRLQIRSWTDKEGNKRKTAEVVADSCYFAGNKKDSDSAGDSQGGSYGGGAYSDTMGEIERQRNNNNSYGGYGGYSAPQYQQGEFAMLEDDDGNLPF